MNIRAANVKQWLYNQQKRLRLSLQKLFQNCSVTKRGYKSTSKYDQ